MARGRPKMNYLLLDKDDITIVRGSIGLDDLMKKLNIKTKNELENWLTDIDILTVDDKECYVIEDM